MYRTPPPLPKSPGVYLFKDAQGTVLYIGKAVNLQARVNSYFTNYARDWKIKALIDEYATIAHIITNTEHDALVLEAQLIQEYQPKYNRLLKEGNPFLYIRYTQKPHPHFAIARTKSTKGIYFGPFVHKQDARKTLHFIMDTFKLYRCGKSMKHGCLLYHIGKCSGSCLPNFDEAAYNVRAALALHMLRNERDQFITTLKAEIQRASEALQFERAKHLHAYLQHVDTLFYTLNQYNSALLYAPDATTKLLTIAPPIVSPTLAAALQELVGAPKPIHSIDCFDISHFQSKSIVGSAVRFTNGVPDKNAFRRFIVRSLNQQNDYAALQEIVKRRYKKEADIPDLILIDGGVGQRNAALAVMPTALIASLAKREETLYCPAHPDGIILDLHTEEGKTLVALRDYTHHFAITYHRLKRRITQ